MSHDEEKAKRWKFSEAQIAEIGSLVIVFVVFAATFPDCIWRPTLACYRVLDLLLGLQGSLAFYLSFFTVMGLFSLMTHAFRWTILRLQARIR
jgi:hypothetical protein